MSRLFIHHVSIGFLALTVALSSAWAGQPGDPCAPQWSNAFGSSLVLSFISSLYAVDRSPDDGAPALYAFGSITLAGGSAVQNIARWDGRAWRTLGSGITGNSVYGLATFDDGRGSALYAVGSFTSAGGVSASNIARWDGKSWSDVGGGVNAYASAAVVFDDGRGSALYVGGVFTSAGGVPAEGVARWDGRTWSAVGAGVSYGRKLCVFDDGSSPALHLLGSFTPGSTTVDTAAKWDGSRWVAIGHADGSMRRVIVLERGGTSELYVAGPFTGIDGVAADRVARWDGKRWSAVGEVPAGFVSDLVVHDDGSGPAMYVTHLVPGSTEADYSLVSRWDGTRWHTAVPKFAPIAVALASFAADAQAGPELVVGGSFRLVGADAQIALQNIALLDGDDVRAFGHGLSGTNSDLTGGGGAYAYAMQSLDQPVGNIAAGLYVAGVFEFAGSKRVRSIARWDGLQWQGLGEGPGSGWVSGLTVVPPGRKVPEGLYVIGAFDSPGGINAAPAVCRWDGMRWTTINHPFTDADPRSIAFYEPQGEARLIVAGGAGISAPPGFIAQWDGQHWSAMGGGLSPFNHPVMTVLSGPGGPQLIVGGRFGTAGGIPAKNIARWDGSQWWPMGDGLTGQHGVSSLTVFDDGTGPALYAAGYLTQSGSTPLKNVARWDGEQWHPVGAGLGNFVYALAPVYPVDGSHPYLVAGGNFNLTGDGTPVDRLARWTGSTWEALAPVGVVAAQFPAGDSSSHHTSVYALAAHNDPLTRRSTVYVGGEFELAGGLSAGNFSWVEPCPLAVPLNPADLDQNGIVGPSDLALLLAAWGPCPILGPCPADLDDNGIVNGIDLALLLGAWG